ncbi:MAG: tetratricopeptide repeat protein [Chloroflexota bacterium]|nr:tetratricopeptide repeat protein [Chloroflexota bacterium]
MNSLATWFRDKSDSSILKRIQEKIDELGKEKPISGSGYVNGRHFVTFVNDVKALKKLGNLDEAERLLLKLIVAMEKACKKNNEGVAPWYYHELAKIYRKKKEYEKEVTILKRFAHQKHARGVGPKKLLERLEKTKVLADNYRNKNT